MKQYFSTILATFIVLSVLLIFPVAVKAVDVIDPNLCSGSVNPDIICKDRIPDKSTTNPLYGPEGILTIAINGLSLVVGILSVITIILSGINFITSQGEPQKVTNARNRIIYAIVGLFVAAVAQGIVVFVLKRL